MSYVIPVDECTKAKTEGIRAAAIVALGQMAMDKKLVSNPSQLVTKEAMPLTDLSNATGGWTTEVYVTGAIAAFTWTMVGNLSGIVAPQLANVKCAAFYKIMNETPNPNIVAIRFLVGANGASTLGVYPLSQFINVSLTPEVYLTKPIVYGPNDWMFIQVYARAAIGLAGERLGFGCFIAEPVGSNISVPS